MPAQNNQLPKKKKKGCLTVLIVVVAVMLFIGFIGFISNTLGDGSGGTTPSEKGSETQITQTKHKKYVIKVIKSELKTTADGSNYISIWFEYTNSSSSSCSFRDAVDVKITQGGIECLGFEVGKQKADLYQDEADIEPNTTYTLMQSYRIYDTKTPIKYEITGDGIFDDTVYASGEIKLK